MQGSKNPLAYIFELTRNPIQGIKLKDFTRLIEEYQKMSAEPTVFEELSGVAQKGYQDYYVYGQKPLVYSEEGSLEYDRGYNQAIKEDKS